MNTTIPLQLVSHPSTPASIVRSLEAELSWQKSGDLLIAYCLRGDMIRLRIPSEGPNERTDLLWEHTCFEAFIGVRDDRRYREFNFSPSGQWAIYDFSDYRQRVGGDDRIAAPSITARLFAGRLELEARIPAAALPPNTGDALWEIGLSAVIESADTVDGELSYWALRHPGQRPDFHHRDSFAHTSPYPESRT